jgi:circadian clock protein KaiC
MFLFDESPRTMFARARGLGMKLDEAIESGSLMVRQVDPGALSAGEFVDMVRREVEDNAAHMIVIDSLTGYLNAIPEVRFLTLQLHELLLYLSQRGVTSIMVVAQQGVIGSSMQTQIDASYLADSVIMLRYFEAGGRVRQAISVMKKRGGNHERTIREFSFSAKGIEVGEPLAQFEGVLLGVPRYVGERAPLLEDRRRA